MNFIAKIIKLKPKFKLHIRNFITDYPYSIISGVLIGTSFIPFPPWALFFCYIPLWVEVLQQHESFKKSFVRGWVTQFVLTIIGFHWIAYVSHEFGFMPWPIAAVVLFLFAAIVHLYIPLATALAQWLRGKAHLGIGPTLAILACLTSLGEMLWPSLFPWNLGYTFLWIKSPIAQVADTIGFQGLSFIVLLINALLTWAFLTKNKKKLIGSAVASAVILLSLHFWGESKQRDWENFDSHLKVLQIQANIGNKEKFMAERGVDFQQSIINQYFNLTTQALKSHPNVDLIIWPESAFPDYLNPTEMFGIYPSQFENFIKKIKKPILTGAYSREITKANSDRRRLFKDYNAIFLYDGNAKLLAPPYHKTFLLIFGEYTPLSEQFPWITKISPAGDGFSRGSGPQVFPFLHNKIGIEICYESLYSDFSNKLTDLGADVIVNVTNDSWFGPSFEPYQHMTMTLARAIEVRRPLLRNTNTGFTTAILADGTHLQRSKLFAPWSDTFDIYFKKNAELTFFAQYGAWLPGLILIVLIGSFWLGISYAKSKTSRS